MDNKEKSIVRVERGLKVPGPAVQPSAGAGLEAGLAERGCGKLFWLTSRGGTLGTTQPGSGERAQTHFN